MIVVSARVVRCHAQGALDVGECAIDSAGATVLGTQCVRLARRKVERFQR